MQPYPWWTLYLEPPFVSDLGSPPDYSTWFKRNMMKYDELYIWVVFFVVFDIRKNNIYIYTYKTNM